MRDLFKDKPRPRWILIVIGNDDEIKRQANVLTSHAQHLKDRDVVVMTICSDDVAVVHGDCQCNARATELAARFGLSLDQFSSTLIDTDDCVKWAAPAPICFTDMISVIDEMPLRDAENAARRPAQVA